MISVIVPVYNAEDTLESCLSSIFKTKYGNYEVVVVDDKSTDGSLKIAKKFPCRIIKHTINKGVSETRNKGAECAKGSILYFVDSDVVQKKDNISLIAQEFSKDRKLKVINAIFSEKALNPGFGPTFVGLKYGYPHYLLKKEKSRRVESSFFQTLSGAIRKDVFFEVKGFSKSFKHPGGEEYEFGHRLLKKKYLIYLYPSIEVYHIWWSLPERTKLHFKRSFRWFPLLLKRKQFESSGGVGTKKEGIISILTFLMLLLIIPSIFFHFLFLLPLSIFILIVLLNIKIYVFFAEKKGLLFTLLAIPSDLLLYLSAGLGVLFSAADCLFKKIAGKRIG